MFHVLAFPEVRAVTLVVSGSVSVDVDVDDSGPPGCATTLTCAAALCGLWFSFFFGVKEPGQALGHVPSLFRCLFILPVEEYCALQSGQLTGILLGCFLMVPVSSFCLSVCIIVLYSTELWETAEAVQYPYLTVCHPRFFNKTKLEEYDIDDTLANYMIMTLDPSMEVMGEILRRGINTDSGVPTMDEMLSLEADLQTVLTRENTTIGQLFKKVAIRSTILQYKHGVKRSLQVIITFRNPLCSCEQFVGYCDVRGNRTVRCCDTVFDPDPIFAFTGTCFKMDMTSYETVPFVFRSINVWLKFRNEITPEFEMRLEIHEM